MQKQSLLRLTLAAGSITPPFTWTAGRPLSTDEQAQGFAYNQTVYPSKKISVAPNPDRQQHVFEPRLDQQDNVFATDVILADSMDKINGGLVYTGPDHHGIGGRKAHLGRCDEWWLRT